MDHLFAIVFSLHFLLSTVFNSLSAVFKRMSLVGNRLSVVFIVNCQFATDHLHACEMLILSLFVQITKFKSFLSSYHLMQKTSN